MQQSKGPVRPLSLIPDFNYKPSILLDSGAYTAWRVGKPIPVEEYADFLIQHEDRLFSYFNLDEINPMDREAAAKISLKNFKYLKGRGLNPIPVFHQGEDMKWLDLMLDSGADYVALSGASTLRGAGRMFDWYDIVWNRLVNTGGLPYVKVHGLADTLENSLRTYPFYSTDSSTWAQNTGKGGNLFLDFGPMPSVRGWDKGQNFSIGVRNDGLHSKTRKDIDGLNAEELEKLAIWLEPFGVTVEHLKARKGVDHIYRLLIGMQYYKNMMNRYHNHVPKLQPRDTIVVNDVHRPNVKDIPLDGPKVFLASWLSKEFTAVFQAHDYPYVLL